MIQYALFADIASALQQVGLYFPALAGRTMLLET